MHVDYSKIATWKCRCCEKEYSTDHNVPSRVGALGLITNHDWRPANYKYVLCFACCQTATRGIYKHYKGGLYEVIGFADHSETGEVQVVYWNLEHAHMYARPLKIWKSAAGDQVRFQKVAHTRHDEME